MIIKPRFATSPYVRQARRVRSQSPSRTTTIKATAAHQYDWKDYPQMLERTPISKPHHQCIVLIPVHRLPLTVAEEFSLHLTQSVLSDWPITFVAPNRLSQKLDDHYGNSIAQTLFPDRYFSDVAKYNALLKSRFFYQAFQSYEYMLIVQLDALVLSDQLSAWCRRGYSYIGAPIFVGFDKPLIPPSFLCTGNGGFSLRRTDDFIKVLSGLRYMPKPTLTKIKRKYFRPLQFAHNKLVYAYNREPFTPRLNEDVFYGMVVAKRVSFFTVPEPREAMHFAFDAEPRMLFEASNNQLPFGCHAWEKYDKPFWSQILRSELMLSPPR